MRVDVVSGNVIHQVGLEENSLSMNVQVKQLQPGLQDIFQVVRIRFCPENRHAGAQQPPSYVVLGTVQQGGGGSAGSQTERGRQESPPIKFHELLEMRCPLRHDRTLVK